MRQTLSVKQTGIVLLLVLFLGSLGGFFGWYVGYYRIPVPFLGSKKQKDIGDIQYILTTIQERYDGQFDQGNAIDGGIRGVLASLGDPHSYYMTKDQLAEVKNQETGQFVGIGMVYTLDDKTPIVATILPNSPAMEAGLRKGERIMSVNGKEVNGFENPLAVQLALRGKEGEAVVLSVLHFDGTIKDISIVRKRFTIENVVLTVLPNKIGLVTIYQFSPDFQAEFSKIEDQLKQQSVAKVIIDIRGNPGGSAEMGTFLADQFIKEGMLVREKMKGDTKENVLHTHSGDLLEDMPLEVLVNRSTGSEAEVFTAAILGAKRGKIFGEKTYGKGTQQDTIPLPDGSAIQLTTGKWFTPNGIWIQGKGITPDEEIPDTLTNGIDPILTQAVAAFQ